jgi:hypothetical protein
MWAISKARIWEFARRGAGSLSAGDRLEDDGRSEGVESGAREYREDKSEGYPRCT